MTDDELFPHRKNIPLDEDVKEVIPIVPGVRRLPSHLIPKFEEDPEEQKAFAIQTQSPRILQAGNPVAKITTATSGPIPKFTDEPYIPTPTIRTTTPRPIPTRRPIPRYKEEEDPEPQVNHAILPKVDPQGKS
jgi:hypothetical protein